MSIESYHQAKELIKRNNELADFVGGCSIDLIEKAQDKIDIIFSGMYRDYLKSLGAGNFGSQEVYGIIHDDFENSSVPDAIWFTLSERREINLPNHLLVIYDTGSDELFCLNYRDVNERGEPKVVSYLPGIDLAQQKYELIAEDFGDFLLDLVEQEIEGI
ncbi:SMI1/KNR4 family protein [Jeotgalibacillus sp. S-D1]|uniref:SMI1/KNR4 family protein n=1 Tax=Jeotgalibacillus sp. S-D1 TaxID=2552189 RepID=UPI001059BBDD|nr:SMI1/KNR4 family protein [Jeotgalibacillus sp. S-D1]TDL32831.1 SMI1/KNR4 family protein [Jeotgalibacillus sp. S-D1]